MKKIIILLSGGFDSPAAAHLLMKKGFNPIFISYLTSIQKENFKKRIIKICDLLKKETKKEGKIYFLNQIPNLETLVENCDRKLTCVICKRLMIRIAIEVGKFEETHYIATGDILGEQASQTIDNLYSYNEILENIVLLRPLIGFDKLDIIKMIKKIGLYEILSQSSEDCNYNPQYPETRAKPHEIHAAEKLLNIHSLIKNTIDSAEILEF